VPIIARVNQSENVERIHAAGADFALSISRVAGQIPPGDFWARRRSPSTPPSRC
jgi:hypothetical protein